MPLRGNNMVNNVILWVTMVSLMLNTMFKDRDILSSGCHGSILNYSHWMCYHVLLCLIFYLEGKPPMHYKVTLISSIKSFIQS